ncbi:MAG: DNA polymerase I [Bacteroidales bacterium]|nr:DNA polymerase I [Bacteroidales bacterium]
MEKKLFLLDAYALIFRAYYALINSPRVTSTGLNTSAAFGFLNTLLEVLKKENPSHIAVCFDPPGPTFRHEAFEGYKAEREATPEDIKTAVPFIKEILHSFRIPVVEVPGYEADDVIGTLAHKAQEQGFTTFMMTPDKDYGQLVTDRVKIFRPGWRGGDFEVRGVEEVCAKYEIESPLQVIDILALMGDKVDNIPGCPGVGEKTAIKLLKQYHSVENLIDHAAEIKGAMGKKVAENAGQIRFSKFLATIATDVPVELDVAAMERKPIDNDRLMAVLDKLEFRSLTRRIFGNEPPAPATAPKPRQEEPQEIALGGLFAAETINNTPDGENALKSQENTQIFDATTNAAVQSYRIASTKAEIEAEFASLAGCGEVGIFTLATDAEVMRATLLGVALSPRAGEAVYMPIPALGEERDAIFAGIAHLTATATLVSGDVKRDTVLLHNVGVEPPARYFDTAVAHYVVQPETGHSVERLAEVLLHHSTTPLASLTGAKGKGYVPVEALGDEMLRDYACELADFTLRLKPLLEQSVRENGMESLLQDVEIPLIAVLADMEIAGVRVDVRSLQEYSRVLTAELAGIEAECHRLAGEEFNVSSPAQVGEILFGKLQLDPKAKKTKKGQYSTTEEVLAKLTDRHPIVSMILRYRSVRKLLTTYVNVLPELINPATGRIHTTYNQTVTATGRLSSTNPNMQNIPVRSDDGREIRKAFIPAPGNVFFSADYSQIELRLVADFSHDATMVEAFVEGHDIHAITASKIYHEPLESVTPDQRRKAKTANFGILYGISAFGLSERLQIPRSEAKELIDGYFATFPTVRDYIDRVVAQAKEQGYVTTKFGRRRMLPDINSRNAVVRSFSERNAVNAPIQGTAADIIKIAMVRIYRRFKEEGLRSKMIMQVHDELNFDVLPTELERVRHIVTTEMQGAYSGAVPLTASSAAAENWLLAH